MGKDREGAKTERKMDILNKVNEFAKYRGGSFALNQKHLVAFKAQQRVLLCCWAFWSESRKAFSKRMFGRHGSSVITGQ